MCNTLSTLGYSPWDPHFLLKTVRNGGIFLPGNNNDRMAERVTTMRNRPQPMGIYRGLPDIYPISHIFLAGRAEGLCAELSLFHHRKEGRKALCASYLLINPKVEPRAPSLPAGPHPSSYRPGQEGWGYTGMYPGRYTVGREIYPGVYPEVHRPAYPEVHRPAYPEVHTPSIARRYHTQHCTEVPHPAGYPGCTTSRIPGCTTSRIPGWYIHPAYTRVVHTPSIYPGGE